MTRLFNRRLFMALFPYSLLFTFVIPYALFVDRLRVLRWVWQSAYVPFWSTLSVILAVAVITSIMIYRLYRGALVSYGIGIFLAIGQPTFLAMREHRHFLLVLLFLLLCLQTLIFESIRNVLDQPFYASKRRWWEAYPKAIPSLHATLYFDSEKTKSMPVRLSNLGRAGCYVFSTDCAIGQRPKQVAISLGDSTILERHVELAVTTDDGFGMGLRFVLDHGEADWSKDLEDYLGRLRRAGYVEA